MDRTGDAYDIPIYKRTHSYTQNIRRTRRMLAGIQETGTKVWSGNDDEGYCRAGKGASREKRIETLGFSLETDDACGSLRVRDYERQLEIRSKQMDCENTSFLSLSPPSLSLSLFSTYIPLSSHFSHLRPCSNIRPEGVISDLDCRFANFPVSMPNTRHPS